MPLADRFDDWIGAWIRGESLWDALCEAVERRADALSARPRPG